MKSESKKSYLRRRLIKLIIKHWLNLHDLQKKILVLYCAAPLQLHANRNHLSANKCRNTIRDRFHLPSADRVTTGQYVQDTGLRDSLKRCSPRSPHGCLCPSRRGYLERRQAEAISEVVCLLFRDLLFAQAQAQLLKRDNTDVAGHVVTLWVQRVGLAGVKVVNKATFA